MIYISIGSNLGNRLVNIQQALKEIKKFFAVTRLSPIIETEALLLEGAPESWNIPFYNLIIAGTYSDSLEILLQKLKAIEQSLGRGKDYQKWSPRIIDLDILLVGEQEVCLPNLTVPHPELLHRPFLIHLLALMDSHIKHPLAKKTFAEIAYENPDLVNCYKKSLALFPPLVGVVNMTQDSFSDGGKFYQIDSAVERVLNLYDEGASVIELGAQSTRPNAVIMPWQEELAKLTSVLDRLVPYINEKKIVISIDSFSEQTILKLLEAYPIQWINDVKCNLSQTTLTEIAQAGCKYLAMHSLTIPPSQKDIVPLDRPPIESIMQWAEKQLDKLEKSGFSKDKIIFDPGIGFNKTPYQSLSLIREIDQLKSLGCEVLAGHSRKSFFTSLTHIPAAERDIETLAVSQSLADKVDYLRVHNIREHQRFFTAKLIA